MRGLESNEINPEIVAEIDEEQGVISFGSVGVSSEYEIVSLRKNTTHYKSEGFLYVISKPGVSKMFLK